MTETQAPTTDTEIITVLDGNADVRQAWLAMVALIPEAGDDDANVRIVEQIINATAPDQLDAPWNTNGLELYDGVTLSVNAVRKRPSDFKQGLGFYLVIDAVRGDTGEKITATTGSVNVVAQLVRAAAIGALPLVCVPRKADRQTARGYYPMHLQTSNRNGRS